MIHLVNNDTCIYEVKRQRTELPFTVVVKNFNSVGHRQFICDLFVSRAWDRGRSVVRSRDVMFCFVMWEKLGLVEEHGAFTPLQLNFGRHRTPLVYRRRMEQVLGMQNITI